MKTLTYNTDLCVVGGGMSGLCCAIAAARHGIKVVLVQDRPVLGGNASSEIRMGIGGAYRMGQTEVKDVRETGIIEEIFLENFYQNPSLKYSLWDSVLYEKAMSEDNLTLLLNSSCLDIEMDGQRIKSVKAWQSNAETFHIIYSKYFADCSGDSILAPLSGADYMYGREAKADFGESIPPDKSDKKTMGMSCLFQIRETDHKVTFTPPSWAYKYESDDDIPYREHDTSNNFWWIEIGGEWDCIHDTDKCREELLKICYGVWDHVKNYGDHGLDNWEIDWIGFLPGKRESRRYVGKYVVTENDVKSEGRFDDIVAYAGWSMDDHFPEGINYKEGYPTIFHPAPQPWGLPLRSMISNNIENLVFAGRNISVTHAALSSSRVMATCSTLGQALGTAVAQAIKGGTRVENINVTELQSTLMNDDCYIPWHEREIPELTRRARCTSDVVRNGKDRGDDNLYVGKTGEKISYYFDTDTHVSEIRLVFDSDLNRKYHNMPFNYPLVETKFKLPETLVKEYLVEGISADEGVYSIHVTDNHQRFVKHAVDWNVKEIRLTPLATHGAEDPRIFDFEVK